MHINGVEALTLTMPCNSTQLGIEKAIAFTQRQLRESLNHYIGRPINREFMERIAMEQLQSLYNFYPEYKGFIKVHTEQEAGKPNTLIIVPENLFTALLLLGIKSTPRQTVNNKYTDPNTGSEYSYDSVTKQLSIKPATPIEYIKVECEIK